MNKKLEKKNAAQSVAETSKSKQEGPYLGSRSLAKELSGYCQRSNKRQKGVFQATYQEGKDILHLVDLLEGTKYKTLKRRPNNSDPYEIIAAYPECRVKARQLRRWVRFTETIDAIRGAGYEVPLLGVTFYSEVARLKSVESITETLRRVVNDDLSVRELIEIVDQIMPPKKKVKGGGNGVAGEGGGNGQEPSGWWASLGQVIGDTLTKLAKIEQAMACQKVKLDGETAKSLEKLKSKIQDLLRKAA